MVKNLPANAEDVDLIPGSGRSPGGGNATHSSILAWEIPCMEEPGGPQSMGSQRVRLDLPSKQQQHVHLMHLASEITVWKLRCASGAI